MTSGQRTGLCTDHWTPWPCLLPARADKGECPLDVSPGRAEAAWQAARSAGLRLPGRLCTCSPHAAVTSARGAGRSRQVSASQIHRTRPPPGPSRWAASYCALCPMASVLRGFAGRKRHSKQPLSSSQCGRGGKKPGEDASGTQTGLGSLAGRNEGESRGC